MFYSNWTYSQSKCNFKVSNMASNTNNLPLRLLQKSTKSLQNEQLN